MNYKETIDRMIQKIESSENLEMLEIEIGSGLSPEDISLAEESFNVRLDDPIKELYMQMNGVKMRWILKSENQLKMLPGDDYGQVYGKIEILDLDTIFLGANYDEWESIIWGNEENEQNQQYLKSLKPFDFVDLNDGLASCFCIKDGVLISDNIFFFNPRRNKEIPMKMNLENYFEAMEKKLAFAFWQEAILYPESNMANSTTYYLPLL
jgi:hypothetical protein